MEDELYGPATLQARLFGQPRLYFRGRRIDADVRDGTLVFLAVVLAKGECVLKRDEIAYTIWPDATADVARTNLRRQLYHLKRLCDDALPFIVDCRTIRFGTPWAVWSDVAAFELLAARGDTDEAIGIQRDVFLPAIDHEWIVRKREALRADLCSLLRRAASAAHRNGDYERALRAIERLHALDPWHEDVLRALISLRCCIGDRAGAVSAFVDFRSRLRNDLGVEPMHATSRHVEAIARGEEIAPNDRVLFAMMS